MGIELFIYYQVISCDSLMKRAATSSHVYNTLENQSIWGLFAANAILYILNTIHVYDT